MSPKTQPCLAYLLGTQLLASKQTHKRWLLNLVLVEHIMHTSDLRIGDRTLCNVELKLASVFVMAG